MPKDPKNIKALYDVASKDYDLGSFDEFSKRLDDPANRQALFKTIGEEYDLGDFSTFNKRLGFDSEEVKQQIQPSFLTTPNQQLTEATTIKEQPVQQPKNIDFNALNTQQGGSNKATTEQQNVIDYGTPIAADAIKKRDEAIVNTVAYKNEQNGVKIKEGSPEFNQQVTKTKEALLNGDLVQTTAKDGTPMLTRGRGFWESAGKALGESFKTTWQGLKMNAMSPHDLANYLEELNREQPYVPESMPSGVAGTLGEMTGGLPKMAGEMAIPYAGLGIATVDALVSSQANNAKRLYQENLKKQTEGKDLTEEQYQSAREDAAKTAMNDAFYQALPDAAMMAVLGTKMGGLPAEEKQLLTAGQTFVKTLKKAGGDVVKLGAMGGAAEGVKESIKAGQGYDVNLNDVVKTMSEGAGQWALMEAAFKMLPVMSSMPSAIKASYKELLTNIPKPVLENELGKLGEQGNEVKKELDSYQQARDKVAPFVNEEDLPSYAGLQEKIDNLTQKKQEIESKDVLPSLKNDAIKSIDKEISTVNDQVAEMQKGGNPLDHEKDNLTGQPISDIAKAPETTEPSTVSETKREEQSILSSQEKPSAEQQLKDVMDGNVVTFTYKSESEVPDVFKDKISSSGETNGEKFVRVTVAKSLADYELSKHQNEKATQAKEPIIKGVEVSDQSNEPISTSKGGKTESGVPEIAKTEEITNLEKERDSKVKDDLKSETKIELIPSKKLVGAKDPLEAKAKHDKIKEDYKTLKKLIDCL